MGTLSVRVQRIRDEAIDVKSFELVSASGQALPVFTPGAHVDVHLADGLARQYSLCGSPSDGASYRIAVKLEATSRGGSQAMHERVREGDTLTISEPRNHFPLNLGARHHLLLAGGIGVTPLLSMTQQLLAEGASFELQYFSRSIQHTAFHDLLSEPRFAGKVAFHYAVEPEAVRAYLRKLLWRRPEGAHLYLCGPRPFMDLVEQTAAPTWAPDAVHLEYFSANPSSLAGPRETFRVRLARRGFECTIPADKTIAEALRGHGIEIETSCEQGVCGTCLTGLLEGRADHRDAFLRDDEKEAGDKILPCVSRSLSDMLVLDL
jgi:vanillate O-demethylase ferredoxin subunit